jgi:hypothetical protein
VGKPVNAGGGVYALAYRGDLACQAGYSRFQQQSVTEYPGQASQLHAPRPSHDPTLSGGNQSQSDRHDQQNSGISGECVYGGVIYRGPNDRAAGGVMIITTTEIPHTSISNRKDFFGHRTIQSVG